MDFFPLYFKSIPLFCLNILVSTNFAFWCGTYTCCNYNHCNFVHFYKKRNPCRVIDVEVQITKHTILI